MSRFLWVICGVSLLGAGCFQNSTPQHSSFLAPDYQSTFPIVRTCRQTGSNAADGSSGSHNFRYLQVRANSIAGDPYTTTPPAGSIVVAEEHDDSTCNSLIGFKLMAKENPGYDSAAGDWHWQELDSNQRVLQDGHLTACSSCHARPPCNGDYLCSSP